MKQKNWLQNTSMGSLFFFGLLAWLLVPFLSMLLMLSVINVVAWCDCIAVEEQVDAWAMIGTFGDSFGTVNALFSGLALVFVAKSLLSQQESLNIDRAATSNAAHLHGLSLVMPHYENLVRTLKSDDQNALRNYYRGMTDGLNRRVLEIMQHMQDETMADKTWTITPERERRAIGEFPEKYSDSDVQKQMKDVARALGVLRASIREKSPCVAKCEELLNELDNHFRSANTKTQREKCLALVAEIKQIGVTRLFVFQLSFVHDL